MIEAEEPDMLVEPSDLELDRHALEEQALSELSDLIAHGGKIQPMSMMRDLFTNDRDIRPMRAMEDRMPARFN